MDNSESRSVMVVREGEVKAGSGSTAAELEDEESGADISLLICYPDYQAVFTEISLQSVK